MIESKRHAGYDAIEQPNFWVSYSDLMAGMLLVFVLLLVVAMVHYAEFIQHKREILEQQEQRMKSFQLLQKRLVTTLATSLEQLDVTVSVDRDTGVVRIESGVLFAEDSAELTTPGVDRLKRIFDAYFAVVLSDAFVDFVKQIEIEGHTNSNGTYLYNLELSQRRALAVMRVLLDHAGTNRHRLQEKVVASGRSFSHLMLDAEGREDAVRSRRIEIKFRLKEAELFQEIYQQLSQDSG